MYDLFKIWLVAVLLMFLVQNSIIILTYRKLKKIENDFKMLNMKYNIIKYSIPYTCDCKFNTNCRPMRQNLQCNQRLDDIYKSVKNCEFYKFLNEKDNLK